MKYARRAFPIGQVENLFHPAAGWGRVLPSPSLDVDSRMRYPWGHLSCWRWMGGSRQIPAPNRQQPLKECKTYLLGKNGRKEKRKKEGGKRKKEEKKEGKKEGKRKGKGWKKARKKQGKNGRKKWKEKEGKEGKRRKNEGKIGRKKEGKKRGEREGKREGKKGRKKRDGKKEIVHDCGQRTTAAAIPCFCVNPAASREVGTDKQWYFAIGGIN